MGHISGEGSGIRSAARAATLALAVGLLAPAPGGAAGNAQLGEGDAVFRPVELGKVLEVPLADTLEAGDRAALGVAAEGPVALGDVPADLLVVEFFNSSCYACARMAPVMDEVWRRVDAREDLRGRVRFVGVGVGNTAGQVLTFHDQYSTPFPMVPDPEFAVFDALGTFEGTPYVVLVRRGAPGEAPAAVAQVGYVPDAGLVVAAIEEALAGRSPEPEVGAMVQAGAGWRTIKPTITPEELQARLAAAAAGAGLPGASATLVPGTGEETFYRLESGERHLWALVAGRAKVCNVCHDIFFIVVFDDAGKVVNLEPILITKYKNEEFDERDAAFLRSRVVGRLLTKEIVFDPEVDAVTAATMSSALVFDTLRRLRDNYDDVVRSGAPRP